MKRPLFAFTLSCCGWLGSAERGAAQEITPLFDFEQPGISNQWTAVSLIEAARVALPGDALPKEAPQGGPAGFGLELKSATGSCGLYSKPNLLSGDLRTGAELELWIFRSEGEAKKHPASNLELQFVEGDGRTRFFRKLEIAHVGWKKYEVPLRWFRWGGNRIPRWEKVNRFGFWLRDPAELQIDAVALERGKGPRASEVEAQELTTLAFPGVASEKVFALDTPQRLVLTAAPQFKLAEFGRHLDLVDAEIQKALPFLREPAQRPKLVVFSTEADYRAFTPRLAARLNAQAEAPRSGGYTLQGVATSFWQGEQPRPVFTHEYVHSVLSMRADLDNRSEWLQEGLANYLQLRFHPQEIGGMVRGGLADPAQRLPLEELASGKPLPTNRYWQAVTLVELLLGEKKYSEKLADYFAAVAKSGSTDLGPHLQPIFATAWSGLSADWKAFCERKYGEAAKPK
jgi:hypothetical protein